MYQCTVYLNTFLHELNLSVEDVYVIQRMEILVETKMGEATIMVIAPGCVES